MQRKSLTLFAKYNRSGCESLPYQDLPHYGCEETGVDYLDTANYEPKDEAKFEYSWQWAYQERFEKAGIMALLGSGFDPGVTNVYTAYAAKHTLTRLLFGYC